jgi:hypothetical protein
VARWSMVGSRITKRRVDSLKVTAAEYVAWDGDPDEPRADLKRPWAMVTREAGLDGLRIHDLRHSFVR